MLCTENWDCQNPMSQTTCGPHHNHQSNSEVQWTIVNLSGIVSAKSTLCFIATDMGYIKPTTIPPSRVFVPVCMLVVTLSRFTHTQTYSVSVSQTWSALQNTELKPVQKWPQIQVQRKLEKKITTGIQIESQLCTGWHIPSAHLQSIPWTAINNVLRPPAYTVQHKPQPFRAFVNGPKTWKTYKNAPSTVHHMEICTVMQQDDAVSLPRHLFSTLKYSFWSVTQLVCNNYVIR
jgi:hypothetical protein